MTGHPKAGACPPINQITAKLTHRGLLVQRQPLRLLKLPVGLLINFGGDRLIDGVQRIMNGYLDSDEGVDVQR